MMVLTVRLVTMILWALVAGVCVARTMRTKERRAFLGNIGFAAAAFTIAFAQATRLNNETLRASSWVSLAAGVLCVPYLISLRKGL